MLFRLLNTCIHTFGAEVVVVVIVAVIVVLVVIVVAVVAAAAVVVPTINWKTCHKSLAS